MLQYFKKHKTTKNYTDTYDNFFTNFYTYDNFYNKTNKIKEFVL